MKAILTLISVMALGAFFLTCGDSSGGSALDIATGAPRDAENISLVDLSAIREDVDLAFLAGQIETALDETLGPLGLDSSVLTEAMTLLIGNQRTFVARGAFSADDLRQRMAEDGYQVQAVAGTEVWFGPIGNIALLGDGRIAVSADFRSLEVMVTQLDGGQNQGANQAVATLLEHLPQGNVVSVTRDCDFVTSECRAAGISLLKKDSTLSDFTFVAIYDTDSEASDARDGAEQLFVLEPGLYSDVTTVVIGTRFEARGAVLTSEILGGIDQEFDLTP